VTIFVEGHAVVSHMGGCCAKIWGTCIAAPRVAVLVTIISKTGNHEAGVERVVADQHLVRVRFVGSHAVPQSISRSLFPIIRRSNNRQAGSSFEVGFASSLVIHENDFGKWNVVAVCPVSITSIKKLWIVGNFGSGFGFVCRSVAHGPSSTV